MRAAPAVSCANGVQKNAHEHTGSAEAIRPSLRDGVTAYFALSPAIGLFCHRRRQRLSCRLDASVEASGPHDFAVRKSALSSEAPLASTASRPASVTMASAPRVGRDGGDMKVIWVRCERKYFCEGGWTGGLGDLPVGRPDRADGRIFPLRHSVARAARTRNLEIPGSLAALPPRNDGLSLSTDAKNSSAFSRVGKRPSSR